ncbi:MAG: hypothetical protein HYY40_13665 [Bacteroidetes bacterium]|nr:hypothetical protein [Bacteroidota bacterium]
MKKGLLSCTRIYAVNRSKVKNITFVLLHTSRMSDMFGVANKNRTCFLMRKFLWRVFFSFLPLFAAGQDFEVAPVVLNYAVEAGQSETKKVSIRNYGNTPQKFSLSISDVVRDTTKGPKILPPGTTPRSCARWLTINPSFIEINANDAKEVEVTLKVPTDGFSTRWAVIHVKAAREQTAKSAEKIITTGIQVTPRISIQVFQSPASNTRYRAMLSDLMETTLTTDTLRKFQVVVNNIGDKRIDGKVYLIASNTETAAEQKFSPVRVSLFPDESKKVSLTMPVHLTPGTYSLAVVLDYGHRTALEALQMTITEK